MVQFRLSAKNFFLTFPQCPISMLELLDHYKLEFGPQLDFACVAEEEHADGSPHLHAILGFNSKRNIRSPSHFDYAGFHCNMQPVRKMSECLLYIQKGRMKLYFKSEHIRF